MRAGIKAEKPWLETLAVTNEENVVDRARLEAALEKIRARVKNPEHGLFGPGSMIWRVYGDQITGVSGGRALMLQTAHPYIAHAVQQMSAYQTDPQGRGERTFRAVINWIYRDMDKAFDSARTVWGVHTRIRGEIANRVGPYDKGDEFSANEQHAQFWVHATGVDSSLRMYEYLYGRLSRAEREQYNEESKLFALLFGIDEDIIPPTWGDFEEYVERMFASDVLTPDQASRDIAKYIFMPKSEKAEGVTNFFKIMTAGLLPAHIRAGYEFPWGRYEETVFNASMKALKAIAPRLPDEMRQSALARKAMHRALNTQPTRLEKRINRAMARAMGGRSNSAAAAA